MKAVLCLWAREHLKGSPGPGSGLALLLKKLRRERKKKKRKKQHSPLCMCVYVCLAKSGKTGRLVLAETLEGSGAAVDAEERRKSGFASSLPDVPAAATGPRRPQQVRPRERRDDHAGEESRSWGITKEGFQLRIFFLRVEWSSLYLHPSTGLLPGQHLSRAPSRRDTGQNASLTWPA